MSEPSPVRVRDLFELPVRVGAVEVARVADVVASRGLGHVLGLELRGADGQRRFLPWAAVALEEGAVVPRSVFALLSPSDLAVHVDNGVRVRELLGEVNGGGELLVDGEGELVRGAPTLRALGAG